MLIELQLSRTPKEHLVVRVKEGATVKMGETLSLYLVKAVG